MVHAAMSTISDPWIGLDGLILRYGPLIQKAVQKYSPTSGKVF